MEAHILHCLKGVFSCGKQGPSIPEYKITGDFIAQNARPNEIVLAKYLSGLNLPERPVRQIVYYAQRNIALWQEKLTRANWQNKTA